ACLDPACIAARPPARFAHAMTYDRARGVIVIFGGEGAASILRDTWEWDGAIWRQACVDASCAATLPSGRFGHAMSYDAARARAVLFGGTSCATASCGDLGDTWEWDGSRWRQASTLGPA